MSGEQIKLVSANCQGLRDKSKRYDVWNYLLNLNLNIIMCLQDTHLIKQGENELSITTESRCFLSGLRTNSHGVAIIIRNNFDCKVINAYSDNDGETCLC